MERFKRSVQTALLLLLSGLAPLCAQKTTPTHGGGDLSHQMHPGECITEAQRAAIARELAGTQLPLFGDGDVAQKAQWDQDRKWMERRLERLAAEMEREPAELPALYRVATRKLEPVGMVYLWPGTR